MIQTFVIKTKTPSSTVKYLVDNFSENVYLLESKFERVVFELFNSVYSHYSLRAWVHRF
jgi:hypothetical protein